MNRKLKNKILLGVLAIVVGAILYVYWGRYTFLVIASIVIGYLTISYLWQLLFCRGKLIDKDTIEFNLSKVGETLMIFYFLALSSSSIYGLIESMPVWYLWFVPIIFSVVWFSRAHEIFANSNDKIIIAKKELRWMNNDEEKCCTPKSWEFKMQKTDCISLNTYSPNTGWHMIITDVNGEIHTFDLKTMNLNGHKNAIEKQWKTLNLNS